MSWSNLFALVAYAVTETIRNPQLALEIAEAVRIEDSVRSQAQRAENYIQKWVFENQIIISLYQSSDNWLRLSVKYPDPDGRHFMDIPVLEPQKAPGITMRCIEHIKGQTPRVDEDGNVQFDPNPPSILKQWSLKEKEVNGLSLWDCTHPSSYSQSLVPLGSGDLSLIRERDLLSWKFFANESRTVSYATDALKTSFVPVDGKYETLENCYLAEDTSDLNPPIEFTDRLLFDLKNYKVTVRVLPEADHGEASRTGRYERVIGRVSQLSSVDLTPLTFPSRLDPTQQISRWRWGVTLITVQPKCGPSHAEIVFEKLNIHGIVYQIAHLTANSDRSSRGDRSKYYGKESKPKLSLINFEDLSWESMSEVWICSARKICQLLKKIDNAKDRTVPFHLAGRDSILADDDSHNCITWAKEQLRFLGVVLPNKISDIFYTHPAQYKQT